MAELKIVRGATTVVVKTVTLGGGVNGVLSFATEAALVATNAVDGTIGYAVDTSTHWLRQDGVWIKAVTGGNDCTGWIYIGGLTVPGGTVTSPTYDDAPGNTVLQSATVSALAIGVQVRASYPRVRVNGVTAVLPRDVGGGYYAGTVSIVLTGSGPVSAVVLQPDGQDGALDTCAVTVALAPVILTLAFTGSYPGLQTELKAGDTFQLIGTADKLIDGVDILDFGALAPGLIAVASATGFTVTGTIADRGTTLQALAGRVRVRDSVTAAFSATRDTNFGGGAVNGVNLINVNNLAPSVSWGAPTYPISQSALKNAESATVPLTTSNLDTILIDSPNGDLSITGPTVIGSPKTVARIGGSYNVATNNLRATAFRAANATQTIAQTVVNIANVAPSITITTPAARLRSGGNDGTSAQDHTISIISNQQLGAAPTISAGAGGGTFQGAGFAGGPTTWTRALRVHDNDVKANYLFASLTATGLSGIGQSTILSGAAYVLGGFVSRSLTFGPFATTTTMGVAVSDFSKLQAGIFTATNQPALKQAIATPPSVTNGYTIVATGVNPTTLTWLDSPAASSNSSGTAQITAVEEVV